MFNLSTRQLFYQYLGQTSPAPIAIEVHRADNIYLYGPDGKRYIDLISGIAVSALGHNHPRIVEAIKSQASQYAHVMVYGEFIQNPQVKLAEALVSTLPTPLNNVFFVNSGSEAIEGAIKLARRYTGRPNLIAFRNAYHGSTMGALSLSSSEAFRQAFMPLVPGVKHIDFGNEADLDQIDNQTAAVVIEIVQGEAGVRTAGASYFENLRRKCDQTGTLLIADEIQSGFGRTGTFWAFEQFGIVPDIVTTAKGMGGGMPLGAFISSSEIMHSLQSNPVLGHITTFGGHPISCAASLATLQELTTSRIYEQAPDKAALFRRLLRHKHILEIRNLGLMMAVQFDSAERVRSVIAKCTELGLITDWFLFCDDAIRIAPPLIITEGQIEEACSILLSAIDAS